MECCQMAENLFPLLQQPGENVSEKRKSSRTAAASASGKMKV